MMIEDKKVVSKVSKVNRVEKEMSENLKNTFILLFISLITFWFLKVELNPWDGIFYTIFVVGSIGTFMVAAVYFILYLRSRKSYKEFSSEEIKDAMKPVNFQTAKRDIKGLVVSKEITDGSKNNSLLLDHENQKMYYITISKNPLSKLVKYKTIPYSEIVQAGVTIDEVLITKSSLSSKVGGYIVGGALGGSVGAVIGGTNTKRKTSKNVSKIELRIVINDKNNPNIHFQLNEGELKDSVQIERLKNRAEEWTSVIDLIIKEQKEKSNNNNVTQNESIQADVELTDKETSSSKIEMLKELEKLKANQTITDDEFIKMKKDILSN